jgi:hypothetical protein
MRAPYAGRKVDASAKALEAHAKALGVGVIPLGGAIDCALYLGQVVVLCDWKTKGAAALTDSQGRLIANGAPLHFVSTPAQLELLIADMRKAASR